MPCPVARDAHVEVTAVDPRTPGRGGIPGLLDSLEKPL